MNNCILNPETNRCVLKNGKVGQEIIKKYGEINVGNCVYNSLTNRCNKSNNIPSPKVVPQSPKIVPKSPKVVPKSPKVVPQSPKATQQVVRIAAGIKLSDSLKNISSNNCALLNILDSNGFKIKKIESLTKKSASQTVIIKLTTDKGVELLAKIGYQMKNVQIDELFVENFIYKFLNKFNLPFVVEYVKQFTCSNIRAFLRQFPETISTKLQFMWNRRNHRGINILLTKMCSDKCKTLYELLKSGIDFKEVNAILLQCMYTLVYFEEIGLQHNDLHFNNIFVEENPSNISLKFNDKLTFNFSSKYLVKIYDFDFSSIVPTKFNYRTFYPNRGDYEYRERKLCITNKSNYGKRDTAQFLLNSLGRADTKLLKYLVNLCLPKELLDADEEQSLPSAGHPCKYNNKNYQYELFPNIQSAKTGMRSFSNEFASNSGDYLNLPDKKLNLISPILPSLAQNCKEYTDMTECIKPNKSVTSLALRKKFNKALIQTAKLI